MKGRGVPDWYAAEPILKDDYLIYMKAFRRLGTCRNMDGNIPWRDIVDYADRQEFDSEVTDLFIEVIMEMNATVIKWSKDRESN